MRLHLLGKISFAEAVLRAHAAEVTLFDTSEEALLAFEPASPVFTLGRRAATEQGRAALATTLTACESAGIPVLEADRGGLGTLHAPGQIVVFFAVDIARRRLGADAFVRLVLETMRAVIAEFGVAATLGGAGHEGLWHAGMKLASVGFRLRAGRVSHGVALNIRLPVGLPLGLALCGSSATRLVDLASALPPEAGEPGPLAERVADRLLEALSTALDADVNALPDLDQGVSIDHRSNGLGRPGPVDRRHSGQIAPFRPSSTP